MEEFQLPHQLTLQERKSLTVTGVSEVVGFDETGVVLRTTLGTLEVRGRQLQLKALSPDKGRLSVEGEIYALEYEQLREKRRLISRLLG